MPGLPRRAEPRRAWPAMSFARFKDASNDFDVPGDKENKYWHENGKQHEQESK
jgi:hypothetical protein